MTHKERIFKKSRGGGMRYIQAGHTFEAPGSTHPADQVKTYRFFKSKGWQVCNRTTLISQISTQTPTPTKISNLWSNSNHHLLLLHIVGYNVQTVSSPWHITQTSMTDKGTAIEYQGGGGRLDGMVFFRKQIFFYKVGTKIVCSIKFGRPY